MTVVCDTSPLLLLTRADRLDLLSVLYSRVVLPSADERRRDGMSVPSPAPSAYRLKRKSEPSFPHCAAN